MSDNGRSVREKKAYLVDGNDEAYTFQTYAGKSYLMPASYKTNCSVLCCRVIGIENPYYAYIELIRGRGWNGRQDQREIEFVLFNYS